MSSLDLIPAEKLAGFLLGFELLAEGMSYISTIAKTVLLFSNEAAFLSPEAYTAMAEWEKKRIPAKVVMTSIEEVCKDRGSRLDSLPINIIEEVVERNFTSWLITGGGAETGAI